MNKETKQPNEAIYRIVPHSTNSRYPPQLQKLTSVTKKMRKFNPDAIEKVLGKDMRMSDLKGNMDFVDEVEKKNEWVDMINPEWIFELIYWIHVTGTNYSGRDVIEKESNSYRSYVWDKS